MNRIKVLRYGSGGLILVIIFVLQSTVFQSIQIRGIVPNLMVITVVSFALLRGKTDGAIAGVILGLLQDIYFGSVVGFYAVIYLYIGYFTGILYNNFYKDSLLIPVGVFSAADFLLNLIVYFFTFLFRGKLQFATYLGMVIIPELIYTLFVGFLLYRMLYQINHVIERIEWSEEYEN